MKSAPEGASSGVMSELSLRPNCKRSFSARLCYLLPLICSCVPRRFLVTIAGRAHAAAVEVVAQWHPQPAISQSALERADQRLCATLTAAARCRAPRSRVLKRRPRFSPMRELLDSRQPRAARPQLCRHTRSCDGGISRKAGDGISWSIRYPQRCAACVKTRISNPKE